MPPAPLARLRALCLALPDAHEELAHGEATFRVRNKVFGMFASAHNHHGNGRNAVWIKATPANQRLVLAAEPQRYFKPPYVGPSGWIGAWLDARTDWREVGAMLEDGYRLTKPPRRLLALLDEAARTR